jgi:hypothetical protein
VKRRGKRQRRGETTRRRGEMRKRSRGRRRCEARRRRRTNTTRRRRGETTRRMRETTNRRRDDTTRRRGETTQHPNTPTTPVAQNSATGTQWPTPTIEQSWAGSARFFSFLFLNYLSCTYVQLQGRASPSLGNIYQLQYTNFSWKTESSEPSTQHQNRAPNASACLITKLGRRQCVIRASSKPILCHPSILAYPDI